MRFPEIFSELQRRRVFRVTIVYAAVAWAMMQVGALVLPRLGLPDWTVTLVVVLGILGFPIALVLAWAYDLTPEGVVRTDPEPPTASRGSERPQEREKIAEVRARDISGSIRSIAVLPFVNMSADPENEYFSDGIAEELLNMLAKVPDLRVAARTSSFAFKGKGENIRRIGEELGVETLLEGSVRKSGDRVRITAQLIDTTEGYHLWSETYDRQLADIFAVQEETARAVVEALQVKLPGGNRRLAAKPTQDPEAHDLYLRGRYTFHQYSAEGLQRAVGFFEKAIERDPGYAPAHAGLATTYALSPLLSPVPEREVHAKAKAAAIRALQIDERLPEAHAALGMVLVNLEWDWERAERHLKRALELNPSFADAYLWYSNYLVAMGRPEEAVARARRAEQLDPLSPATTSLVALVLYFAQDYDAAAELLQRALELDPNYMMAHWYLGLVYMQQSRHVEAIAALERAVALSRGADLMRAFLAGFGYAPAGRRADALAILDDLESAAKERPVNPNVFPIVYAALAETDRALYWMERVIRERLIPPNVVRAEPIYEPLRSDPRLSRLLKEVGLG